MSLETYRAKRRFEQTPEPRGNRRARRGMPRFVVQKHAATRLHYDFRLEMGGVLKSWTVPKGPSLNPDDKRLAMMVEDHPIEYGKFEGVIPEGNYGAGKVFVWDEGDYELLDESKSGVDHVAKGRLRFVLHGHKLRGQFSLIQMKRGKGNEWLLIKHRDEFAGADDILEKDKSVLSGRRLESIGNGASRTTKKSTAADSTTAHRSTAPAGKSAMPHRVKPMLATLVDKPFDRPGWLFEIKWDGYRAIAEIEHGKVRLYSRNFLSFIDRFPTVVRSLAKLKHDAVLDGEVVALDAEGKSDFQALQNAQKTGQGTLVYCAFDLLFLDGKDLRQLPLVRRKELLEKLVRNRDGIQFSEHVEETGSAFFNAAIERGLEGIIAKNGASAYADGVRGWDWLKIRSRRRQEAVICGFTAPRGQRQSFGALVLGVYDDGELTYVGHTGGGFDSKSLTLVHKKLKPLVQAECPFLTKPRTNTPVRWVRPILVCEVAFHEWTGDGIMRQPIFQGLREDKKATEVTRESPAQLPAALEKKRGTGTKRQSHSRGTTTKAKQHCGQKGSDLPEGKFTNLDKVYWPKDGYTKGDLLRYYHEVAAIILPHFHDRPLVLHRHPNGIEQESFFQKDVSKNPPPAWVKTIDVRHDQKVLRYVVCQDEATLLYVANLGCIELNPWNSRIENLDRADFAILDLDPQDLPFQHVVDAANEVRKVLDAGEIESTCKTSGKRGLHICIPLGGIHPHERAREFAEVIARFVHHRLPKTTSIVRNPAQRRERVYLDFLQNGRGKTMASVYSVRPVSGACVSTPLKWTEVGKRLDPKKFTIETIRRRLDRLGDLWKPMLGKGIELEQALDRLAKKLTRPD